MTPAWTKAQLRSACLNKDDLDLDGDLADQCDFGDWKLLHLLSKNMEPVVFGEFLVQLCAVVQDRMFTEVHKVF